jgi:hypothetical protein
VSVSGNLKLGPSQDIRTHWTSNLPPNCNRQYASREEKRNCPLCPRNYHHPRQEVQETDEARRNHEPLRRRGQRQSTPQQAYPYPPQGTHRCQIHGQKPNVCVSNPSPPLDHDRVSPSDLSYVLCCLFKLYSHTQTQVSVRERCAPASVRAKREGR